MRHGIRSVLSNEGLEIVGETETLVAAVAAATAVRPDVVLVDQDLPGGDLLDAIRTMHAQLAIETIVMTDELDDQKALDVIEAGAAGYILKDIPGTNLAAAIWATCQGRASLHPSITRALMNRLSSLARLRGWDRGKGSGLTARELDIIAEVARGRTDEEIAQKFVVTAGTIKTHIRHILRKLPARNRAQAVAQGFRRGLIK